ncbi:MAG: hypothetical protein WAW41_03240 [Methylobacter sp.]
MIGVDRNKDIQACPELVEGALLSNAEGRVALGGVSGELGMFAGNADSRYRSNRPTGLNA